MSYFAAMTLLLCGVILGGFAACCVMCIKHMEDRLDKVQKNLDESRKENEELRFMLNDMRRRERMDIDKS